MLSSLEINRPVEEVFAFIEDGNRTQTYLNREFQIRPVLQAPSQDGIYRVGSKVTGQGSFAGVMVKIDYKVAAVQPDRLIKLKSVGGQYDSEVRWQLQPVDDNRTRLFLEVKVKPLISFGFMLDSVVNMMLDPLITGFLDQSLAKLKHLLENERAVVAA